MSLGDAPIVLSWDQTIEDVVTGEVRMARLRLRRQWRLFLAVALIATGVGALTSWGFTAVLLLFSALLALALTTRRSIGQRVRKNADRLVLGTVRWEIGPRGIRVQLPTHDGTVPWARVVEVALTREQLLLFLHPTRALFVPRRALGPDPDGIAARLREWAAAEAPPIDPIAPPEAPWVLAWEPTVDEHVQFLRGLVRRRGQQPRALVVGVVLIALSLAEIALSLVAAAALAGVGVVSLAIGLLVLDSATGGRGTRRLTAYRVRRDPTSFPLDRMDVRLGPAGLWYATPRGSGLYRWAGVYEVLDVEGCVILLVGPLTGFPFPDRVLGADRARFVEEARRWMELAPRRTTAEALGAPRGEAPDPEDPFAPPRT